MTREQYIEEFNKYSLNNQREFMAALLPDFCQVIMSNPEQTQEMKQMCSSMMDSSVMPENWQMPPFGKGAGK